MECSDAVINIMVVLIIFPVILQMYCGQTANQEVMGLTLRKAIKWLPLGWQGDPY